MAFSLSEVLPDIFVSGLCTTVLTSVADRACEERFAHIDDVSGDVHDEPADDAAVLTRSGDRVRRLKECANSNHKK